MRRTPCQPQFFRRHEGHPWSNTAVVTMPHARAGTGYPRILLLGVGILSARMLFQPLLLIGAIFLNVANGNAWTAANDDCRCNNGRQNECREFYHAHRPS